MTQQQFLQLKKQIDRLLEKAEDEAIEKGVNIASPEFQNLLREVKRKLLEARGISLEEYERIEGELEKDKTDEEVLEENY